MDVERDGNPCFITGLVNEKGKFVDVDVGDA